MRLTLLGTGGPIPDPNRAGPSTLVQTDGGTNLLIDAGRGVVMRLAGAGVMPTALTSVLLTHRHSDHITDLNDLITTRWVMSATPSPLPLVGPPGTRQLADRTIAMLEEDACYRMAHHDDLTEPPGVLTTEVTDGVALSADDGTVVIAAPTDHRPVTPTVGYRIEHGDRAIVLAGDTVPCDGLDRLCQNADVLVHTVIRADIVAAIPNERVHDIVDYHSTVEQAAQTAARNGVRTLVLTHMAPIMTPGSEHEWRDLALQHFDGAVVVGEDLLAIEI